MKRFLHLAFFAFVLCLIANARLWAQGSAQIGGTVRDASGAVIPGVEITATQADTGAARTTVSNETGSYVLPNLPVGPYRLEAKLPGFRTFVQSGIVLQVNSSPVVDPVLDVGQVAETVEVQANAAMVEARATGVGQVIENQRILELPLIGRQVTDLVVLSGAATLEATTGTNNRGVYPGTASFSIAGGLAQGNAYTLDGTFHNDVYASLGLPLPFPDAIQEFKVETSAVPASSGYRSGGAINAVTKSGTNQFHGTGFEFLRNDKFNARPSFGTARGTLKRHQFGGTLGGPIQRNKLFFFGGYQGTLSSQAPTTTFAFVPTPRMLAGDFTVFNSRSCRTVPAALRAPFADNRVDPALISPQAVNIVKRLPPAQDECGRADYISGIETDEHQIVGKADYNLSATHSVFGRYMIFSFDQPAPYERSSDSTGKKTALATAEAGTDQLFQSLAIGDTYSAGANIVNAFRGTWTRTAVQKVRPAFFGAADVGINIYQYIPQYLSVTGAGFTLGGQSPMPNKYHTAIVAFTDDLSMFRGNHQMTFGGTVMGFESNTNSYTNTSGLITIDNSNSGLAEADFLLGKIRTLSQGGPNMLYVKQKYTGFYAQDTWKAFPYLTINAGLRWEPYFPQQYGKWKVMHHFDMDAFLKGEKTTQFRNAPPGMFYPGDPKFGPNGTAGMYKQWKNVAPRAGISWDPSKDGKTVVRAAYGIFYNPSTIELNLATGQAAPWSGRVLIDSPSGGLADPYRGFPGGNPFPFAFGPDAPYPQNVVYTTYKHDTRVPYVQQWNLGIQRQFGNDWLLSASYIGNAMVHLPGAREVNPAIFFPGANCTLPNGQSVSGTCSTTANTNQRRLLNLLNPVEGPKFSTMEEWDDGGTRNYNSMLLNVQKRFNRNYSVNANYTWGHCIGDPVNVFFQAGLPGSGVYTGPTRAADRGDCTTSGTDIRQIFNMTTVSSMPKFSGKWTRMFASNWRLSTILRVQSGPPLSITTGSDLARTGKNPGAQRPNQILPDVYGNQCFDDLRNPTPGCLWLNPAAFALPAVGTVGNMGPGTIRGPGNWDLNAGLSRIFDVTERHTVEFRAEANNVLNHTNYGNPVLNLSNADFGRIRTAGQGRIMQFALKYVF